MVLTWSLCNQFKFHFQYHDFNFVINFPHLPGVQCEREINECFPLNPCYHGGTCIDGMNSFQCLCPPGIYLMWIRFIRPLLPFYICPLLFRPYLSLFLFKFSYLLNVQFFLGYTDPQCHTEINECQSNPCQHGICQDLVDKYVNFLYFSFKINLFIFTSWWWWCHQHTLGNIDFVRDGLCRLTYWYWWTYRCIDSRHWYDIIITCTQTY